MSHPSLLGEAPDPDATGRDEPLRPDRPALIELAAALLIVGGVLGLIALGAALDDVPTGVEAFVVVTAVLDIGAVVIGVLVRFGRAWIVAVNYVAVIGFLDLLAAPSSGLSLIRGVIDLGVVIVLVQHKPWFEAMARWRRLRAAWAGRTGGRPVSP